MTVKAESASVEANQSTGPVFIVGMNGSGTTMLLDSLCRHSQLYGFPRETRLMPHVLRQIRSLGDLGEDQNWEKAWSLARSIPAIKFINDGKPVELPSDWLSMPRDAGAIFDRIFAGFAAGEGKRRWCEKTPQHVQHLALLKEVFPNAKFIHMIRDGRACAASFRRRWKRSPRLTIFRWKNVVRLGVAQGRKMPDSYMEVHYEQLTSEPETWMRKICDFLDLPFEPAVLESRNPQSDKRGSDAGINFRGDTWRSFFCAKDTARLEQIAGSYLRELGYETESAGDEDPTSTQKKYWRAKDSVWLLLLEIQRKRNGSKKPWSRILTQPLESIRQGKANDY